MTQQTAHPNQIIKAFIAQFVDIPNRSIYPARLSIADGRIQSIERIETGADDASLPYLLPGFIDAHVHIESSMLVPAEFARLAVVHGTVGTVSDPHEIANVCGVAGVEYMIENGKTVPFKFNFGAPSCVPATVFETAGAHLDAEDVAELMRRDEIKYLAEVMNFPGVLNNDPEIMAKIAAAKTAGKPIDGHAPGLRGDTAGAYIAAGISTDHECFTIDEALDKLKHGMKIIIREGSAAKNFDALIPLLNNYPDMIMFCSDDKHPDSLAIGHINQLCARAVTYGINIFNILQAACVNPVKHYKLDIGLLQPGDFADFIMVKDLVNFEVSATYIDGQSVAANGKSNIVPSKATIINNFSADEKCPADFEYPQLINNTPVPVIEAIDGQLITHKIMVNTPPVNGLLVTDIDNDILKIAVVNRYKQTPVAKGFIKNFGLKQGAIASSVAHDSHNIVVVGVDDASICRAVNLIIKAKGGISCVSDTENRILELPIAGLMSDKDGYEIAEAYTSIDAMSKKLGATLLSPFMTLSFMALLVIPHLKLSDMGLFDAAEFKLIG
ncbi:adenine deaminase [Mucilaginibacter polytrichastri]|uniref:Adenine deaminase n=1 Tax=Mucilaginibacter polytrichastri TaxID=1302689 RepID=A0A1Q5ZX08_9SPHI|nr:adenine deaminase [Mucilaginibacter polytrichastri]OKS86296.1 Adenine deaminase [Mucilaginibacter polytrichastri]SFT16719.1 Adenine deaminase [Mucilaginibacter polytrichastri]